MPETAHSSIDITCPRCGSPASVSFYGPCASCRDELRATMAGERRSVDAAEFEPKMHVTPNAVALKE